MTDIFISYARSTAVQAKAAVEALRAAGYGVWIDEEIPAHRPFADVIEERLAAARAVVVLWSAEAAKSHWVQSEADRARADGKLVQLNLDGARLPMPFDRIQCVDLSGWTGDPQAPGWRKVLAAIGELLGGDAMAAAVATAGGPSAPQPPPLPGKPSIVVMPFADLSGEPGQEYFVDGMLIEIVEALSRIKSIFVIAAGSSLSLKGQGLTAPEASRRLGVRYVLEGSVRKAADRVRIGVQLIDGSDGVSIWTHRFEDTLEDVFALQDSIALAVAGRIEPAVEEAEIRRAAARPTDIAGSHDLYLRALPLFRTFGREEVLQAMELLRRAVEMDADFAPALAMAASCLRTIVVFGWSEDPDRDRGEVIALARRAMQAGGDDAGVFASAANDLAFVGGDLELALSAAKRAVSLNPGSASVWFNSAFVELRAGDSDLAAEQLERAMRLDPAGPSRAAYLNGLACARLFQGRYAEAVALAKERSQIGESPSGHAILAAGLGHLGEIDAARAALGAYAALSPQPIEAFVRSIFTDERQVRALLDGVALAQ